MGRISRGGSAGAQCATPSSTPKGIREPGGSAKGSRTSNRCPTFSGHHRKSGENAGRWHLHEIGARGRCPDSTLYGPSRRRAIRRRSSSCNAEEFAARIQQIRRRRSGGCAAASRGRACSAGSSSGERPILARIERGRSWWRGSTERWRRASPALRWRKPRAFLKRSPSLPKRPPPFSSLCPVTGSFLLEARPSRKKAFARKQRPPPRGRATVEGAKSMRYRTPLT